MIVLMMLLMKTKATIITRIVVVILKNTEIAIMDEDTEILL
jgi:hypothetical protein